MIKTKITKPAPAVKVTKTPIPKATKTKTVLKVKTPKTKTVKKDKTNLHSLSLEELAKMGPTAKELQMLKTTPKPVQNLVMRVTMLGIRALERVEDLEAILALLDQMVRESQKSKTRKKNPSTNGTKTATKTLKSGAQTIS